MQGMDVTKQEQIDQKMRDLDGTDNKARLGANAILAVSMGVCKVCYAAAALTVSAAACKLYAAACSLLSSQCAEHSLCA